jgi:hypothetical protein
LILCLFFIDPTTGKRRFQAVPPAAQDPAGAAGRRNLLYAEGVGGVMRIASDDIAGLLEASAAGDERAKSVLYELAKLFCGTLAVIVGCTLCLAAVVRLSPSPFLRMPLPNRLSSSERMCEWGTSHGRAPCSCYNSVGAPEISEWYSAHVWSSVSVACLAGLDVLLLLLQGWWQETRHEDGVRSAKGAHQSCSLVAEAPINFFSLSEAPTQSLGTCTTVKQHPALSYMRHILDTLFLFLLTYTRSGRPHRARDLGGGWGLGRFGPLIHDSHNCSQACTGRDCRRGKKRLSFISHRQRQREGSGARGKSERNTRGRG